MSSTNNERGDTVLQDRVPKASKPTATAAIGQLLRFLVVGGLNTAFGYSLFAVLTYFGMRYPAAIGLATIGGVLFNFQSVGRLVFNGAPRSRFWRFVGVYVVIYLLNLGGVRLALGLGANVYLANAITLIPLSLLAFILNRRFVFNLP
jgi:putative flippase GtrA